MSVLRNDQNLSTADIVNADKGNEPRAENPTDSSAQPGWSSEPDAAVQNRQPQQGAANAVRTTEFPDLADASDPRTPTTRNPNTGAAEGQRLQLQDQADTTRRNESEQSRGGVDRDTRPVQSLGGSNQGGSVDNAARANTAEGNALSSGPLFPEDELHNFRAQWDRVQASFVDEPRQAVQQADSLVANVVKRIAEQFAEERSRLEQQWDRGDDVSTEDLRQGLRRYRAFFDRLLSF
jgi:hypothetical protein